MRRAKIAHDDGVLVEGVDLVADGGAMGVEVNAGATDEDTQHRLRSEPP